MDENTTPAHYTDTRFCGKDGMVEVDLARDALFKRNIVKSYPNTCGATPNSRSASDGKPELRPD